MKLSFKTRNKTLEDLFRATYDYGVIHLFSGTVPTTADSALTGTLLGTITTNGAAVVQGTTTNGLRFAATAANGTIEKDVSVWSFTGLSTGSITHAVLVANATLNDIAAHTNGDSVHRIVFTVGVNSGEIQMNTLNVVTSVPGYVNAATITLPAS